MTTELLFRDEPYGTRFEARVLEVDDEGGVVLDRTLFYPRGGGQPGDAGTLQLDNGTTCTVTDTVKGEAGTVFHRLGDNDAGPQPGAIVRGEIDWSLRYPRMRMHTCMHLLSVAVPAPVTGGALSEVRGRLDFDLPESTLDREEVEAALNDLIARDDPVTTEWITAEELAARPELVKTMSVKPPLDAGPVRLVRIGDIDLQPCGGTHIARTGEIGRVRVAKIEKKSRHNRRVNIVFNDD
ncbi:MAG: alanyl-tRNA editing protein [Halofilum sp. (in: g-proteobacteria)]|nr:alanyl-tRNA editing protein [Halofilum sp. (in: g-proteobacteria)]